MEEAPHFADTYQRYKAGNKYFVQWLVDTARATGTVNNLLEAVKPQHPPGGRPKGKARKEHKKLGPASSGHTHQIPERLYHSLAVAIADAPNLQVPQDIFIILRSIIRDRRECGAWYRWTTRYGETAKQDSNATHVHFVSTLQSVLIVLKKKEQRRPQVQAAKPAILETIERLNIDNDSEPDEQIVHPMPPLTKPRVPSIDKDDSSEEDLAFAVHCLLKDCTKLRIFVLQTWREFSRGEIRLQAAGLTMNVAINMVKRLDQEFQDAFPYMRSTEEESMHAKLIDFVRKSLPDSHEPWPIFIDLDDDKHVSGDLHPNTIMCTHLMDIMAQYLVVSRGSSDAVFAAYPFEKVLLETLQAFRNISPHVRCHANHDYVYRATYEMEERNVIDTWMLMAVQMMWDMQQELGSVLEASSSLIGDAGLAFVQRYNDYLDLVDYLSEERTDAICSAAAHAQDITQHALGSDLEECTQELFTECETFTRLLQLHPGICSMLLAEMREQYHVNFITTINLRPDVLVCAHFYNAARRGSLLKDLVWDDMEWFINQQGSNWIFVGDRPKAGRAFLTQLILALGGSITKLAKNRRLRPNEEESFSHQCNRKMQRRMKYHALQTEICVNREASKSKKITAANRADESLLVKATMLAKAYFGATTSAHEMSSLETLSLFKKVVEADEPAYTFDLARLQTRCTELIEIAHKKLLPPELDRSRCSCSPIRVLLRIMDTLGVMKKVDDFLLSRAAEILQAFVEEHGDSIVRDMESEMESSRLQIDPTAAGEDKPKDERYKFRAANSLEKVLEFGDRKIISCAGSTAEMFDTLVEEHMLEEFTLETSVKKKWRPWPFRCVCN